MQPASPVFPGRTDLGEVIYAKDQPEYLSLPAVRAPGPLGRTVTRWRLTWRERVRIFCRGDLYLSVLTFGQPLQPVKPETLPPDPPGEDDRDRLPEFLAHKVTP